MSDDTTLTQVRRRRTATTDREIVRAVYRLTPAGTSEVAEVIGRSRQSAAYRLKRLEEDGPIWSKKVGPTRVWMHEDVLDREVAP